MSSQSTFVRAMTENRYALLGLQISTRAKTKGVPILSKGKGQGYPPQTRPPCRHLLAPERAGAPERTPKPSERAATLFARSNSLRMLPEITRSPTSLPGE